MSADYWLGLDIGATKLLAVVVRASGELVCQAQVPTLRAEGPAAVIERAAELSRALISDAAGSCRGVGVGFAGLVDTSRGRVSSSVMLPGWNDVPLAEQLSDALDLPVRLENDATAAGWGEFEALGAPEGMHLLVLTVGTGIGAALFIDGRLHRGASGVAGELGNTTIDWRVEDDWGPNPASLNSLASGTAIASDYAWRCRESGTATLEEVAAAAADGTRDAIEAIEFGARALGAGLANSVQLLNPHRIALAGGVANLGEPWLADVRAELERRIFPEARACLRVDLARHGGATGAFGAAGLARSGAQGGA